MRRFLLLFLPLSLTACDALIVKDEKPTGPLVCTKGWTVTGYFTPVEADYSGGTEPIKIPGSPTYSAVSAFLREVEVQGWGRTKEGWFVAFYDGAWHRATSALAATGTPIQTGAVAVDPRVVKLGAALRIPSLPAPWKERDYQADDVGTAIAGQHVDVYTGMGADARAEAFRLTTFEAEVCHNGG